MRAIVVVLDGCGAGEAPDAAEFGDEPGANTLLHVAQACGGLDAPHLTALGFLAAAGVEPVPTQAPEGFQSGFGRLKPLSRGGKDSVCGHWEMMGIVLDRPFPTYPDGFPIPLVKQFEREIGTQTLGNRPASGTQIISELGALHVDTGFPILYTSADSVFQLAAHEEVVPVETLYEWCEIARKLCVPPNDVQRVIARPFLGSVAVGFRRTGNRRDFPAEPPQNLLDTLDGVRGIGVVPELFGGRGFLPGRRTQSNSEHAVVLAQALGEPVKLIFANFEDFDMLYGHRNDPQGFGRCLESFDRQLGDVLKRLEDEDVLILTADHGNDPTDASTDHNREYVPVCVVRRGDGSVTALGDRDGFAHVGGTVASWLKLPFAAPGLV